MAVHQPEPSFQNGQRPPDQIIAPSLLEDADTVFGVGIVTVTSPEQIPAALAQGKPVLIDIPAVQWRLSWLVTIAKWVGMWLVGFLMHWWLGHWLDAQLPNKDYLVPD